MDDPFEPKVAESVQVRFGSFVDAATGQQSDVVFLTIVARDELDGSATYVFSSGQARGIGQSLLEGGGSSGTTPPR